MKTLDQLPDLLDKMLSEQKEQKNKTYVARYKGQNLIVRSGKSSWKKVGHAKTAIIQHFDNEEREYKYREIGRASCRERVSSPV